MKHAVVLLSGGLDSATALFVALREGYRPHCLIFDYGQRHRKEIAQAIKIAQYAHAAYTLVKITLPWKGSSLLDKKMALPQRRSLQHIGAQKIPSTYVSMRNIIFLSFAASCAESIKARSIFIGANIRDYSGYPDCRPEFFKAFQETLQKGSKSGVENRGIKIMTPLIRKTKAQIIALGQKLKVPYHLTWSCYGGGKFPCGVCDSCILRKKGFDELDMKDPLC